jgi:hypothetical protein
MAIHESQGELGKQREKRVFTGSLRAECRSSGLDKVSPQSMQRQFVTTC